MSRALAASLLAAAISTAPSLALGQAWLVQSGVTAKGEYNDNYFFTTANKESAFTGTIAPFVSVARRTEASDVTGILAVGGNKVWGLPDSSDYLSVRFALNGTLREDRTLWTGIASFVREQSLQSISRPAGIVLELATTNTGAVTGTYTYELTERWSAGATAGWTGNYYDSVDGGANTDALSDNSQYFAGGNLGYSYSDRTRFTVSAVVSHYTSDITSSDSLTASLGAAHEFSQRLKASASVGGYWSDIKADELILVCPTTPILCDTGAVPRIPVLSGKERRESGALFGGSVSYDFSERTRFSANLAETISPDGTGTITKTENAGASLSHRFSERISSRLGATYKHTKFPTALNGSSTTEYYGGEAGVSFQLAERWILDAGYRHLKAKYSENNQEPESNVVFVSIGYNWPDVPMTNWMGVPPEAVTGVPGAGPVSLPEERSAPAAEPPASPPGK